MTETKENYTITALTLLGFMLLCGMCLFPIKLPNRIIKTPVEYAYKDDNTTSVWKEDSVAIVQGLHSMQRKKVGYFYSFGSPLNLIDTVKSNFFIDTMLLSPARDKAMMLLVLNIHNWKDSVLLEKYHGFREQYFMGFAAFAKRDSSSSWIYDDVWLKIVRNSREECSEDMRYMYFVHLSSNKDSLMRYNFDDVRIWNEPIWDRMSWDYFLDDERW